MTISFELDDYLASGVERDICVPVEVGQGEMDQAVPACRLEMTVGGQTRDIWLSGNRTNPLEPPPPRHVVFGETVYALAYDVDRKPLGFEIKLDDFEVGFEPGTQQATKFESQIRLTDKSEGIRDEMHTIWMNHPMDHRGYTFYQSRYITDIDPATRRPTGRFQSVFQVATNPGRPIIYGGCMLIVLGIFAQFYMKAGVFSDGGRKERAQAAARARAAATKARETAHRTGRGTGRPVDDDTTTRRGQESPGGLTMRRFAKHPAALALAAALASGVTAGAAETALRPGTGAAYDRLGHVAVMHHGRVKPLDTVAREEVKQIYGRETIVLRDPREEIAKVLDADPSGKPGGTKWKVDKWGPVGAFLEWTVRPEFWDDQPFILVDYLPLRRAVLAGTIKSRLEAVAAKETTPDTEKARLKALATDPEVTAAALTAFVRGSKLPAQDRESIAELTAKLTEEHKWLTPRELESATLAGQDGRPALRFLELRRRRGRQEGAVRPQSEVGRAADRGRAPRHRRRPAAHDLPGL